MGERPDFLIAYNAVEVPPTMRVQDAIDEQLRTTTDTFFENIYSSLDLSPRTLGGFFEFKFNTLVPLYEDDRPDSDKVRVTDDMVHSFRRKGSQALAAVMSIRDDPNYTIAHFAKYPLLPQTEDLIRDLQRLERIELGLE